MKLVTLAKVTLNHLPEGKRSLTAFKAVKDDDTTTLRDTVIQLALENGENRSLDTLAVRTSDWNSVSFDIHFNPNQWSSLPYAKCEIIPAALEVDGRYFKLDEIKA